MKVTRVGGRVPQCDGCNAEPASVRVDMATFAVFYGEACRVKLGADLTATNPRDGLVTQKPFARSIPELLASATDELKADAVAMLSENS